MRQFPSEVVYYEKSKGSVSVNREIEPGPLDSLRAELPSEVPVWTERPDKTRLPGVVISCDASGGPKRFVGQVPACVVLGFVPTGGRALPRGWVASADISMSQMAAPWSVYPYFAALVDYVIMPGGSLEISGTQHVPIVISGTALKQQEFEPWRVGESLPKELAGFSGANRDHTTIARIDVPAGNLIESSPAPRYARNDVELSWKPVEGAAKYHCGIIDLGPSTRGLILLSSQKLVLAGRDLTVTSIKVKPDDLNPGHAYAWYVSAENVWGAAFSEYGLFHVLPVGDAPAIGPP
ncbi:MAG: hypothetical protein JNK16_09470 [Phycisphaerales bacterium]|nr:hypothetical protein [Phycisphaerales bacterium]